MDLKAAFDANRALWNARVPHHLASRMYDMEGFMAGKNSLTDLELQLLGDVKDKRILHLQCHFGQDTLSLARMGAEVTGLDISDAALAEAARLTEKLGLKADWVLSNVIDHVPARLTAFGFAVVGNFEEAIGSWRRDAALWQHPNEGTIIAAAAGALGIQLGGAAAPGVTPDRSKTFTTGSPADATDAQGSTPGSPPHPGHLQSVVGLVWRSVVLWMLLVALLSLANVLG